MRKDVEKEKSYVPRNSEKVRMNEGEEGVCTAGEKRKT
jgi:hypothetical protein